MSYSFFCGFSYLFFPSQPIKKSGTNSWKCEYSLLFTCSRKLFFDSIHFLYTTQFKCNLNIKSASCIFSVRHAKENYSWFWKTQIFLSWVSEWQWFLNNNYSYFNFSVFLGNLNSNNQFVSNMDFPHNRCPVCYKSFKRLPHVHRHYVETHMCHADFECPRCYRKFKRRYQMEHHAKTCDGFSKYQCMTCHSVYSTKEKLVFHIERKHDIHAMNWYYPKRKQTKKCIIILTY